MKTNWPAYRLTSLLLLVSLALFASPTKAMPAPSPKMVRVDAQVNAQSVRIETRATGSFEYTSYRPSANLLVVDLAGVVSAEPGMARVLKSGLVSSYRTLQHGTGENAVVRLEVLLRAPAEPRIERRSSDQLTLIFEGKASPNASKKGDAPYVGTPSSSALARVISQVEIGQTEQEISVRVHGDGRLTYQTTRMTNPARVVLDFAGVRLALANKSVPGSVTPVRAVRLGQFRPDVSRVVIDLDREVPYDVHADGKTVAVTFAASPAVPALHSQKSDAPLKAAKNASPASQPKGAEPASAATPMVESSGMSLPESLTQQNASLASPAAKPQAVASAAPAATTSAPAQPAPQQPPAKAPAAPVAGKYSGEPISVNLKDVDLRDFFRLIHEISGLNVVLDPSVKGSLTIVLDEIPWDQALDIVLQNNSLDKQLEGNVLRVATRDALKREAETKRDLAKAEADAVPQVTATRVLSYTKAASLRDTVKKFLSARGDVLADERSNTLIIRDIPVVLPQVDNLIRQLDRKGQQVEIEARVVAASRAFARDIGTQFGFATTATGRQNVFGGLVGRDGFTSPVSQPGPPAPPPPIVVAGSVRQIPLNTNLGAGAPTSGFTFSHLSTDLVVDYIISAAESKGVGKLLSKPRVITQNNEKATVKQGTKVPIQTTINNTISVQFIDAVLKLEVTPQITADGTIFMEVVVENTQIDAGIPRVQGIPALNTQSTETKVLINDGGTVVIGGVIISSQRTDISQVPLFGSVPLIGHLFKRTSVNIQSQELLFFLTPRILPG